MKIAIVIFVFIVGFITWCFMRVAKSADNEIKKILDLRAEDEFPEN